MRTLLASLALLFFVGSIQASLVLSVSSMEDGHVLCTLTNTGASSERFLQYGTPFDSDIFASVLDVTDRLGRNAKYIGKVGKRVFPAPESAYLTLAAGESISAVLNIHQLYHVHEEGVYRVSARVPQTLQAIIGVSASQYLQQSPERIIKSVQQALTNQYSNCDSNHQNTIESSRVLAEEYTYQSSKCLDDNTCDTYSTKWFAATKSVNKNNYNHVRGIFDNLKPALAAVNAECGSTDCDDTTYAFVFPDDETQLIHLCNTFFNPPDASEQPQTIIHEYSHFNVIGGTDDYSYGTADCLTLALTDPDKAARNADNIGYFAVDIGETAGITASIDQSNSNNSASNNSPNSASNNSPNSSNNSPNSSNNSPNSSNNSPNSSNNSPNSSNNSPSSNAAILTPLLALFLIVAMMI